ncbi:hypothetical protein [Winogradskyella sp. MIT101101]|uniref:hypothetical protein n=1 Tax=Winogradskyella sp. MIT101101 TaxID=3098297 RepID=UPI0039995B47
MAPIKFEEQLKDKLEKRSLQPSADSWAKLSQRLDTEEKKSRNPWFWWMGIAAGLIIMLAIAVEVFGSKDVIDRVPQMVEEDTIENTIEPKQPNGNETQTTELAVENEQTETEKENANNVEQPEIINYKSVTQKEPKSKTQFANTDETKKAKAETSGNANNDQKSAVDKVIINKEAFAGVIKDFKSENTSVTDREVDSLLKLASKELFKDKLQKETAKTVDANLLLEDVEDEMGQSFRSKVFDALKDSYETVKTAVAERNN